MSSTTAYRDLLGTTRAMFIVAAILVLGAGASLFLLTEQTDRFFAWPIGPPMTAAFMGALYWSAAVLQVQAARQPTWYLARASVPGIVTFTVLTLIATLIHREPFKLDEPIGIMWLTVYIAFPPLAILASIRQARNAVARHVAELPAPNWLRLLGTLIGLMLAGIGIGLYVAPTDMSAIWPWTLSELTGRTFAAWLIGLGLTGMLAMRDGDIRIVRQVAVSTIVLGVVGAIALFRYGDELNWGSVQSIGFVGVLGVLVIMAIVTILIKPQPAAGS